MVTAHSLAASIRSAQESVSLDLSGLSASSIEAALESALSSPLDGLSHMIRITFITGAGKQARQKYDDGAQKAVTSMLQQCGYVEDRGAGCDWSSAGTFKVQHDTGKNLKTVVVFPKLVLPETTAAAAGGASHGNAGGSLVPENSPGYKIAVCSMSVFRTMIRSNCTSWSQKKDCLTCIEGLKELVQDLDAKLIQGTSLSEAEQKFYDDVVHLDDKEDMIKELAHDQVEQGSITVHEKQQVLQQNSERIAALSKEGKSTDKAIERRTALEAVVPMSAPHKLKHHAKIAALYKELKPLLQMDTKGGRLLSIKESVAVTRKEDILEEIERLEGASREWFEEDDIFAQRVEACRREFQTQSRGGKSSSGRQVISYAAATGGGSGGGGTSNSSNNGKAIDKWMTPTGKAKGPGSAAKKKGKSNKSGLFGAMMMDSSDEEEEEQEKIRNPPGAAPSPNDTVIAQNSSKEVTGNKKAPAKKKKGKKSSATKNVDNVDDDTLMARAARENEKIKEEAEQNEGEPTALSKFLVFVQTYVLPLLVAILGWIIGLLFGKDKKQQKQKRG